MARRLKVKWSEGQAVEALIEVPAEPFRLGVLLAHGAGAGQRHPFMEFLRSGLARAGLTTMTFDYAYMDMGRRAPDRMPKLLAVHAAAAERLATYVEGVVLAGKSMGGRVGSHLAGDEGLAAAGVVYYGYPLVPIGKGEPRPTDHLQRIEASQLFFVGTRDRLSPLDAITALAPTLRLAEVHVIEGGDHSFRVPKRFDRDQADVMDELVAATSAWVHDLV